MSASETGLTCMEFEDRLMSTAAEKRLPPAQPRSTYPLRLPRTMRSVAIEVACLEGISLNQLIVQALAEKITRLQHSLSPREILPKPRPD